METEGLEERDHDGFLRQLWAHPEPEEEKEVQPF